MKSNVIIDVWMQHPTMRFINQPMFDSLRRWTGGVKKVTEEIPVEFTIAAMDKGGVQKGLLCAWWGPQGSLISNDEVAAIVSKHPDRFIRYCISEPIPAHGSRPGIEKMCYRLWVPRTPYRAMALGSAGDRSPLLSTFR